MTDVDFWQSVRDTLVETLEFVSGDRFDFAFVPRTFKPLAQVSLDIPPAPVDDVVLFSGGLDSLTGAFESLVTSDDKLLLVTHRSATKITAIQINLFRELRRRFPNRIAWVPARGRLVGCVANETTQRSRSFLYAALGYAAASVVSVPRMKFYENGVVSLNLPISRQVVGTMATRTTHPLFLHRLEKLFSQIAEKPIAIDNPYAWLTKTEVVTRLRDLGGADLISMTTSCSSVRQRTKRHPLCGCCSQCLDRRFATLGAGAAKHDPADRYEVDVLHGPRHRPQDRTMVNDWTRHATRRLARMTPAQFSGAFAAEMADVELAFRDRRPGSVLFEAFHMHRRHGDSVRGVLAEAISAASANVVDGVVPACSLLSTYLQSASEAGIEEMSFLVDAAPAAATPDATDAPAGIFPLRLEFDAGAGPYLRIGGLGEFRGAHLKIVDGLKPNHDAACAAGLEPDHHEFVLAGALGDKGTVRQHAKRCRDEFAESYEAVEGAPPQEHLLIHSNARGQGYRLDPEARFVAGQDGQPELSANHA